MGAKVIIFGKILNSNFLKGLVHSALIEKTDTITTIKVKVEKVKFSRWLSNWLERKWKKWSFHFDFQIGWKEIVTFTKIVPDPSTFHHYSSVTPWLLLSYFTNNRYDFHQNTINFYQSYCIEFCLLIYLLQFSSQSTAAFIHYHWLIIYQRALQ